MGEVIVITSGKGGVGKTTTTANIGIGLSQLQKKVVVIDTDLGLRNLDVVMGLENRIVYNLVDVIEGGCRLKQALIKDKRFPELYLLPSAQTKDKTSVSPEQMKKLIEELKTEFDYILLDCPAGIEQGFQNAIAGADRGIVVTTPEVSAIRDADRIIGLLEAHGIKNNDLIINRLRIDMVKRGDMMSVEDVTEILAIHLLGVIPDDEPVSYTHLDVYKRQVLGLYALIYLMIGYVNGLFSETYFDEDIKLPLLLIAGSEFVYGLLIYFLMFMLRGEFDFVYYLMHVIIPELIYTVGVTLILYQLILWINQKLEAEEKRSASKFV